MQFFASLRTAFYQDPSQVDRPTSSYRSGSSRCSCMKMAALIALVSSVAFALFAVIMFEPWVMALSLVGVALLGVLSYDLFVIAGRMQAVFDQAETGQNPHLSSYRNRYTRMNYLMEGTLLARPLVQLSLRNSH